MSGVQSLVQLRSSYRTRRLSDTLAIGEALAPALGISRVTDITRLDRLGLPVYASIRPRSKGVRVTAGKGVTGDEARASALMEAIEHAVAEPQATDWPRRRLALADVAAQLDDVHVADFVPNPRAKLTPRTMVTTTACERVGYAGRVQLPAELVFYPYREPESPERLFVSTSTNGLASGNSVAEATLHGLLEVLERDALAMNRGRDASRWVDSDGLPEPFRGFAEQWRQLGVDLGVRYIPNEFELPCFYAVLSESASTDVNLAAGAGLHVDRDVALSRAVCEAAQSRLGTLHGGRDDITHFYSKYTLGSQDERRQTEQRVIRETFDTTHSIAFGSIAHRPAVGGALAAVLDDVLAVMRGAGLASVFRHRFRMPLNGLHVVKVIVPKSELIDQHTKRIGRRLLERITAHG